MKARVLSTKYRPRNQGKENGLGRKDWVEIKETGQRTVTWEIKKEIWNLAWQNRILKNMAIWQFLNLQGKEIDDDFEVIIDKIAKAYSIGNKTHKIDKENVVIPKVKYSEIIKVL